MFCSQMLSDDDNDAVLFEKIKKGNYDADDPIWENISPDAKDIVAKLLTVDSAARLTAEEALGHRWVLQLAGIKEDEKGKTCLVYGCIELEMRLCVGI